MAFDVARVRGLFPTLGDGYIHLDGPAGTLIPEGVARAVSAALRVPLSNRHGPFPSSARADALVDAARRAFADLVGGEPAGVILGPNMTTLTYVVSRALAKTWKAGDEIVVSRLDHDANVRPWIAAAKSAGAVVRWAEVDIATCELPDSAVRRADHPADPAGRGDRGQQRDRHPAGRAGDRRRAHAARRADLCGRRARHRARPGRHGGDRRGLLGDQRVQVGRSAHRRRCRRAGRLGRCPPDKLVPSPDAVPDRFETGTPAFELMAGAVAAVDHLAGLDDAATGSRRQRVLASMAAVRKYEASVFSRLDNGLRSLLHVYVLGSPQDRAPTASFSVEGWKPRAVTEELARRGICAWDGDYYAYELMESLGVGELGGAVRVGLVHYNTAHEVDRLLDALAELR